jgi:hypothetical protein
MKTKLVMPLIAAPLLALSSMAFAAEPVQLSASEMDGVTAGVYGAGAIATATAVGNTAAATFTATLADSRVLASVTVGPTTFNYVASTAGATSSSSSL